MQSYIQYKVSSISSVSEEQKREDKKGSTKHRSEGSCFASLKLAGPAADAESVVDADCELSARQCWWWRGGVSPTTDYTGLQSHHTTGLSVCPSTAGSGQNKHREGGKITATGILMFQSTQDILTFPPLVKKSARNCSSSTFVRKGVGRFTMELTRTETLQHCRHCRLADTP